VQRFGLTSDRDRSKDTCTSPLPKSQQSCIFHTRGPAFQGTPSATKLKGSSRRVTRAPVRIFVSLMTPTSEWRRSKERVWEYCVASMPTFCLEAIFQWWWERAERHEENPSREWYHFLTTAEDPYREPSSRGMMPKPNRSGGVERAKRHEVHSSHACQHFFATTEAPY
jgi:hypothetical protein